MANIKQIKAKQQGITYSPLSSNSYASQRSAGTQPVLSPTPTNGGSPGSTPPPAPTTNPNTSPGFEVDYNPAPVTSAQTSSLSDLMWAWMRSNWMWILLILLALMLLTRKGSKSMPLLGN